ncbi:unnamed protein product [Somion occarium]|uniref:Uncharacterized protein n=1 Tax=Somion occarium TaxID=3059160 RepID=A0ABP1DRG4_9APHY
MISSAVPWSFPCSIPLSIVEISLVPEYCLQVRVLRFESECCCWQGTYMQCGPIENGQIDVFDTPKKCIACVKHARRSRFTAPCFTFFAYMPRLWFLEVYQTRRALIPYGFGFHVGYGWCSNRRYLGSGEYNGQGSLAGDAVGWCRSLTKSSGLRAQSDACHHDRTRVGCLQ